MQRAGPRSSRAAYTALYVAEPNVSAPVRLLTGRPASSAARAGGSRLATHGAMTERKQCGLVTAILAGTAFLLTLAFLAVTPWIG
jgi:hypothetical protein